MAVTTRLQLYKPVGTDLVSVDDHLNDQYDIIDAKACKAIVAPNGSPPTADFVGQEWFTSDTKEFKFWNGSSWVTIPFASGVSVPLGPGYRGFNQGTWSTDIFTVTPNTEVGPILPFTLSVKNGKSYRLIYNVLIKTLDNQSPAAKCWVMTRVSDGTSATTSGELRTKQLVAISRLNSAVSEHSYCIVNCTFTSNADKTVTVGLFLAKNSSGHAGSMCCASTLHSLNGLSSGNYQFVYAEEM
jgi:hypothetical protein